MRKSFQNLPIKGQIVIGEGERDQAPMLFIGEKVGQWKNQDPEIDIAVDPLEGTNLCVKAARGAVSTLALSKKRRFVRCSRCIYGKNSLRSTGQK